MGSCHKRKGHKSQGREGDEREGGVFVELAPPLEQGLKDGWNSLGCAGLQPALVLLGVGGLKSSG